MHLKRVNAPRSKNHRRSGYRPRNAYEHHKASAHKGHFVASCEVCNGLAPKQQVMTL